MASLFTVYPGQKAVLFVGQLSDLESPKNITITEIYAKCSGSSDWIALPRLNEITSSLLLSFDVPQKLPE